MKNNKIDKFRGRVDEMVDMLIHNDSWLGVPTIIYKYFTLYNVNKIKKNTASCDYIWLLKMAVCARLIERYFNEYNQLISNILKDTVIDSDFIIRILANINYTFTAIDYCHVFNVLSIDEQSMKDTESYKSYDIVDGYNIAKKVYDKNSYITNIGVYDNESISLSIFGIISLVSSICDDGDSLANCKIKEGHDEFTLYSLHDIKIGDRLIINKSDIQEIMKYLPTRVVNILNSRKVLTTNNYDKFSGFKIPVLLKELTKARPDISDIENMINKYVDTLRLMGVGIQDVMTDAISYEKLDNCKVDRIPVILKKLIYKKYIISQIDKGSSMVSLVTSTLNIKEFISFIYNNISECISILNDDDFRLDVMNIKDVNRPLYLDESNSLCVRKYFKADDTVMQCNFTYDKTMQHRWDIMFLHASITTQGNNNVKLIYDNETNTIDAIALEDIPSNTQIVVCANDIERVSQILKTEGYYSAIPYLL